MPLDKLGREYTPMSEAEKAAHRARPYPPEFTRLSQDLARWTEAHKNDAPIQHRAAEARETEPEPLARAIQHHMKGRKPSARRSR